MIANKYILQYIFNQTFHLIERCEVDYIHYLLVKLLLVSKSFVREVLCGIAYPTLNITSIGDLKKAMLFMKHRIPILLSINIPQNRSSGFVNSTVVMNCVHSIKNMFGQEKASWDQVSGSIKCFTSYESTFLSWTESYDRLESVLIEDPINNRDSNALLNLLNSKPSSFPQLKELLLVENDTNISFDPAGISVDVCNKISTLKVQSTQEFHSFAFIQQFKHLAVLHLDLRGVTNQHYRDMVTNIKVHPNIQDLRLMFRGNVKIESRDFIGNGNITTLYLSHDRLTPECVQSILDNNKTLKHLSIIATSVVFTVLTCPRKEAPGPPLKNSVLQGICLRGLAHNVASKWTEPSNLRCLNVDELLPNISATHPHLERLTIHTNVEPTEPNQISAFLKGLANNQTIEYLEIDIKTKNYLTQKRLFPSPMEFLTRLFCLFPKTNIRHFKFTIRGYTHTINDFNQQDQLLLAIKNNSHQLYSLFLNSFSSDPIINDINILFTVLESLEYIQLFECNQSYSLTDKQYLRFKHSIAQLKYLKFLNIQLVLNPLYQQNLKHYLSSLGIFNITPKNKVF
ncbi:hypothetical protein CYY_001963 [Polysphondylium violaceum]|uniref:Uncharacterized protein n=1 Tax=Polysphondylium violaceum TaxID=133409 RepID=A0A8J4Q8G3_9MYCE|nr:hypothetical protein CYY_001963 [Polysphondylium violaceum]